MFSWWKVFIMRITITLIRLRGWAGWFKSPFGAHVQMYVFGRCGSYNTMSLILSDWSSNISNYREHRRRDREPGYNSVSYTTSLLSLYIYSITNPVKPQWLEHFWDNGKIVRDMDSSSHWGLIMVPGQEANSDNLGNVFRFSRQLLYVKCTH